MGSQTLSILRQGIWASITGGWYYDPRQSHASNVFHLYIWLLLLVLPIGTNIIVDSRSPTPPSLLWTSYCIVISVIFISIKMANVYLHRIFDAGDCVIEEEEEADEDNEGEGQQETSSGRRPTNMANKDAEYELLPLASHRDNASPTMMATASSSLDGPPAYLLARILSAPGTHLSYTHDDTSAGAVHCFQDEFGNWMTYTFDENCQGTVRVLGETNEPGQALFPSTSFNRSLSNNSSSSSTNSALIGDMPTSVLHAAGKGHPQLPSRRHSSSFEQRKKSTNTVKEETTVSLEVYPKPSKSTSSSSSGPSPVFTAPVHPTSHDVSEKSVSLKNSGLVSLSEEDIVDEKAGDHESACASPEAAATTCGTNNLSASDSVSSSSATSNLEVSKSCNIPESSTPEPGSPEGAVADIGQDVSKVEGVEETDISSADILIPTPQASKDSASNVTEFKASNVPEVSLTEPDDNKSTQSLVRRLASNEGSAFHSFLSDSLDGYSPNRRSSGRRILELPVTQPSFSSAFNGQGLNEITLSALRFTDFTSPELPSKPKQYFKLWLPPFFKWVYVKVRFDRLHLLALLDKNTTPFELIVSIVLAILVAVTSSLVIMSNVFQDIPFFIFCFVIAGCQYTLLKSVQPDAASPTHGYNRIIIYSRPIYFIICCTIILVCHWILNDEAHSKSTGFSLIQMYHVEIFSVSVIHFMYQAVKLVVLAFPLIFSFGLLPQIDTFAIYLMEQIEVHVFGGSASTTGLTSAIFAFSRSLAIVALLYGLALASLHRVFYTSMYRKSDFAFNQFDVAFSVFCGILTSLAYLLSRSSSDPTILFKLVTKLFNGCRSKLFVPDPPSHGPNTIENEGVEMKILRPEVTSSGNNSGEPRASGSKPTEEDDEDEDGSASRSSHEYEDPLPHRLEQTVLIRLQNDLIICVLTTIVVFAIHVSTIFTLQPTVEICLGSIAIVWGFVLHYLLKQSRKELPWLCFSRPFLRPYEHDLFEVKDEARLMCFERLQAWLWLIEKNAIYPLFFLSTITRDTPIILDKYGFYIGTLLVVICGFKAIRSSLSDSSSNYMIVLFTYIIFEYDLRAIREVFLINYFFASFFFHRITELLLKIKFVVIYVAPWQITWGSAFHAFAQPFSVPHSAMLLIQALVSTIMSAPLQPVLGSAIFITSYVRPIKFWERDYNTKRVDHSNTRLASQLDRNQLGNDDNNLNSIFYEHLTRSLQTYLYGDLALGRWGQVSSGDCFVLASDNLNCLVHIIELANGLVTFQVRGLEFRGTYCQQREVEALSEGVSEDEGCCCCETGHLPSMLSLNAAFNQRWLAWEVTHTKYVLEGYSISDNSAVSMLQPYELRRALITYYVKSVIFYTIVNRKLQQWITNKTIDEALQPISRDKNFVDLDPIFMSSVDEDFDYRESGISRSSFCKVYLKWIKYCLLERARSKNKLVLNSEEEHKVISLCFALSLLARRALSAASHHNSFASVDFLLYGLHALFKGDFRITSPRDEWVFQDMDLLKQVVAPAVRMAVKLHQDHFMSADEYEDNNCLYLSIDNYDRNLVISHEADPVWRNAVLSNVDSLLALRHVFDEGSDRYKFIVLNKRFLSFRVIKINKECVRGLWAGQQQELIYLRNRNPERGSIQNAKQALRNIINSSCDQPIGYPIYVSPLTTSFAETSPQLARVIGQPFSFGMFRIAALRWWTRTKLRFDQGYPQGMDDDHVARSESFTSSHRHRDAYGFSQRSSRTSHKSYKIDSVHRPTRRHGAGSRLGDPFPVRKGVSAARRRNSSSSISSTHVNISALRGSTPGPVDTLSMKPTTSVDIELGSRGSSSVVYRVNPSIGSGTSTQAATVGVAVIPGSSRGSPSASSSSRPARLSVVKQPDQDQQQQV